MPTSPPSARCDCCCSRSCVVADHLGRLLEVGRRGHLVEDHAARHRVRKVLVAGSRCDGAAPADRFRASPRGSRSSARGRRSRTSMGRGRRRGPACWCGPTVAETLSSGSDTGPGTAWRVKTAALPHGRGNAPTLSRKSTFAPSSDAVLVGGEGDGRAVLTGVFVGHQVLAPILGPLHRAAQDPDWRSPWRSPRGTGSSSGRTSHRRRA